MRVGSRFLSVLVVTCMLVSQALTLPAASAQTRSAIGATASAPAGPVSVPLDTSPPSAPATLTATDRPGDQGGVIDLAWSAAADDVAVTGYRLYRGTTPGAYDTTRALSAGTSYTDTSCVTGTPYYYVVTALDAAGNEGPASPEATAIAADNLPPTVALVKPAAGATVSRMVSIVATAQDLGSGLDRVEFRVGGSLIGVATAGSHAPYFSDAFDALDTSLWNANYHTMYGNPSTGSTTASGGVVSLRPSVSRGMSALETGDVVVTSLPAHVSFRVRFPGSSYRSATVELSSGAIGASGTTYVGWHLGETNHAYTTKPFISLLLPDGTSKAAYQTGSASVIPSDTWLDGSLDVYADHVTSTFNGVELTVNGDVASIVAAHGGLHFGLLTNDDSAQAGFDLDQVTVGQQTSYKVDWDTSTFLGTQTIEARAFDVAGNSAVATEVVNVVDNFAPAAQADSWGVDEDTALTVDAPGVLANDTDADKDPLSVSTWSVPGHGTLAGQADGSFVYRPAPGWSGVDTFSYRCSDGESLSGTATVTITVAPVNDNDIPGVSRTLPLSLTGSVNNASGDRDDVSAVYLTAGQEYVVTLYGPASSDMDLCLFPPGTTSVNDADQPPVEWSENDRSNEQMWFIADETGWYYIDASLYAGAGGSYTLSAGTDYSSDDTGDNGVPLSVSTTLGYGIDILDEYSVKLAAGQSIRVTMSGSAGTDFDALLLSPAGTLVGYGRTAGTSSEDFGFKAPAAGIYHLGVLKDSASRPGSYTIDVAEGTAPTSITIKTNATSVRSGAVPILSGAVTPTSMVGKNIVVYVKKPGSARWTYSSNRTVYAVGTAAAWQYKYSFKPGMPKGVYIFKAEVPAWPGYRASTSPTTVSIRLR